MPSPTSPNTVDPHTVDPGLVTYSDCYISTDDCWGTWTTTGSTTLTNSSIGSHTTSTSNVVWSTWNDHSYYVAPKLTPEQRAEQEKREEEVRKKQEEENKRRQAASKRARELLLDNLSKKQREQFKKHGWFVVEGGKTGKSYRVQGNKWAGNVEELTKEERVAAVLCAHVRTDIPIEDNLLAQKLILEADEEAFLKIANVHWRNAA